MQTFSDHVPTSRKQQALAMFILNEYRYSMLRNEMGHSKDRIEQLIYGHYPNRKELDYLHHIMSRIKNEMRDDE